VEVGVVVVVGGCLCGRVFLRAVKVFNNPQQQTRRGPPRTAAGEMARKVRGNAEGNAGEKARKSGQLRHRATANSHNNDTQNFDNVVVRATTPPRAPLRNPLPQPQSTIHNPQSPSPPKGTHLGPEDPLPCPAEKDFCHNENGNENHKMLPVGTLRKMHINIS